MKRIWVRDNRIHLYESGDSYFSAVLTALRSAESEIIFLSYIFKSQGIGNDIATELKAAARRGIKVDLVVDGVGSSALSETFVRSLKSAGVNVHIFRPLQALLKLGKIFFRRLHHKLVVVDKRIAFVGGINVDQDQYDQLDFAVSVEGPLTLRIYKFGLLFLSTLHADWLSYFRYRRLHWRDADEARGSVRAGFAVRDNFRHRRRIEKIYLHAIRRAKKSILIANAYFFPGFRFRQALIHAAKRGVRVRLLLQGRTDHPIVRNATALLHRELIQGGIEIIEYHQQMLHAKVAVIDGNWSTVGSCNLDFFSLFLSLEGNIVIDDPKIAKQLEARLEKAIKEGGIALDTIESQARSPWDWFISWLSLISLRLLRFLSGV